MCDSQVHVYIIPICFFRSFVLYMLVIDKATNSADLEWHIPVIQIGNSNLWLISACTLYIVPVFGCRWLTRPSIWCRTQRATRTTRDWRTRTVGSTSSSRRLSSGGSASSPDSVLVNPWTKASRCQTGRDVLYVTHRSSMQVKSQCTMYVGYIYIWILHY